jgi:5,10-methylenetetrahydromethanopterin reductase
LEIDVILEPDHSPAEIAELAQLAESFGIRAIWHQNYVSARDPFMSLVLAAQATRRIRLGVVVVSPYEMHPLKMANALLTLNEFCGGRACLVVGAGGEWLPVLGVEPERRVRVERETIEIIKGASPDQMLSYEGQFYRARGYQPRYATDEPPLVYAGASREQMLRMGGRVADGVMMSDVPLPRIEAAVGYARQGLARRQAPIEHFHLSNIWAWHIKADAETARREARRELALRGVMKRWYVEPFLSPEDADFVEQHRGAFFKAYWQRTHKIEGVSEHIIQSLLDGLTITGDLADLDEKMNELSAFQSAGVNELAFRIHDDPADSIRIIGKRVVPEFT